MSGYYSENLSGESLQRCYEIAPPRVKQYLEAEALHVAERLRPADRVLELGCGYGRVALKLAAAARRVVGIDSAEESLKLARQLDRERRCEFVLMDAVALGFRDDLFDAVLCVQNGICAFGVDQVVLLREALRVTRSGGIVMISSYSDRIWTERLAWFDAQASAGLMGPVDHAKSGNGIIVCKDGFRAGRMTPEDFQILCSAAGAKGEIVEVDGSCVFCEVVKQGT